MHEVGMMFAVINDCYTYIYVLFCDFERLSVLEIPLSFFLGIFSCQRLVEDLED